MPKERIEYIVTLRGFACLWVLVHHAFLLHLLYTPSDASVIKNVLLFGSVSVDLFLVVSGFCLALPFLQNPERKFAFGDWMKRRFRRVYPAYLGVFALSALIFSKPHGWADVVLHLLLLHNLLPATVVSVNAALWSMALEVQLYVVAFGPLLFLLRRYGPIPVLALSCVISLGGQFIYHEVFAGGPAYPYGFTASVAVPLMSFAFAGGMVAAWLVVHAEKAKRHGLTMIIATILSLVYLYITLSGSNNYTDARYEPGNEQAISILFACMIVTLYYSKATEAITRSWPARALSSLGVFSYSVYLIHLPVMFWLKDAFPLSDTPLGLVLSVGLLAAIIALGYGLFLIFERPFLKTSGRLVTSKSPAVRESG